MRALGGALLILLAACSGENPDRVASLPDENSVFVDEEPAPAPTPAPDVAPDQPTPAAPDNMIDPVIPPAPDRSPAPEPTGEPPEDLLTGPLARDRAPEPPERFARYTCRRAPGFVARFDRRYNTAYLNFEDGAVVRLEGQPAASGLWYRGEGFELRGRGNTATLVAPDGSVVDCFAAR